MTTVKQDIGPQPDLRQAYQHTYRARLKTREHEDLKIEQMLKNGVVEFAIVEWSSRVVLAPKKDEKRSSCVDYKKLSAVTTQDTSSLPRMD